jgi:serine/threonine-protein kinase
VTENTSADNLAEGATSLAIDTSRSATAPYLRAETSETAPGKQAVAEDPRIGTIIADRYQIERLLGMGGMGAVYLGVHTVLHKRVAIKFLRAELTQSTEIVERLKREAIAAANIDHPNVVAAHDFGKDADGCFFLVLDYVDGMSLGELLEKQNALEPLRVLAIAQDVGAALGAAHHKKIVHRDLKPDNIVLVQRDGEREIAKVIDFGIAKNNSVSARADGAPALTQAGMVFGTPEYMAPEQALGADVDHRADLYAFAVLLFEALAGQRPYAADDVVSLLGMQLSADIPKLSVVAKNPRFSVALDNFFLRALAKQRNDRFSSAAEMVLAFQHAIEQKNAGDVTGPISAEPEITTTKKLQGVPNETAAPESIRSSILVHGESLLALERETLVTLATATQGAWQTAVADPKQRPKLYAVAATMVFAALVLGPVRHYLSTRPTHATTQPQPDGPTPIPNNLFGRPTPQTASVPPVRPHHVPPTVALGSTNAPSHPALSGAQQGNTNTQQSGQLQADLAAFRADPRIHVLLDPRGMQSLQSKIDALEGYRLADNNPLLTYTVGVLYGQQRGRGDDTMLDRFAQCLGQRPDLATDPVLIDSVLQAAIRGHGDVEQKALTLLHGPLQASTPPRLFARLASERTRRNRERDIAFLTREFPASIDAAALPLIDLYRARNCGQLKVSIEALTTAGDARALGTLQALPRPPQRCGWSTCNPCLGDSVDIAIAAIRSRNP